MNVEEELEKFRFELMNAEIGLLRVEVDYLKALSSDPFLNGGVDIQTDSEEDSGDWVNVKEFKQQTPSLENELLLERTQNAQNRGTIEYLTNYSAALEKQLKKARDEKPTNYRDILIMIHSLHPETSPWLNFSSWIYVLKKLTGLNTMDAEHEVFAWIDSLFENEVKGEFQRYNSKIEHGWNVNKFNV